jgi:hypothetical protein
MTINSKPDVMGLPRNILFMNLSKIYVVICTMKAKKCMPYKNDWFAITSKIIGPLLVLVLKLALLGNKTILP